jgi:hypothetical protein
MSHNYLLHLLLVLEFNAQFLYRIVIIENVQTSEVEEHANGDLKVGGVILFCCFESVLREVGQTPVVEGAGDVVKYKTLI